jgi:hypothetical protein
LQHEFFLLILARILPCQFLVLWNILYSLNLNLGIVNASSQSTQIKVMAQVTWTTQHKSYSILVTWLYTLLFQLPKLIHKVEKLLSWVFSLSLYVSFYGLKILAYISIKLLPSIRLLNENRIIWCTVYQFHYNTDKSVIYDGSSALQEFIKFLKMLFVMNTCDIWNWLKCITTSPSPNFQLHIKQWSYVAIICNCKMPVMVVACIWFYNCSFFYQWCIYITALVWK